MTRGVRKMYDTKFNICADFVRYLMISHDSCAYYLERPLVKMRRGREHSSITTKKGIYFSEERMTLKSMHKFYSDSQVLPISRIHYYHALSRHFFKEALYHLRNDRKNTGRMLMMQASILNPFDKQIRGVMLKEYLPRRIFNSLLSLKKSL